MSCSRSVCEYFKTKYTYKTGCGFVAPYNKFWRFCPYCRKTIIVINHKYNDDETKQRSK